MVLSILVSNLCEIQWKCQDGERKTTLISDNQLVGITESVGLLKESKQTVLNSDSDKALLAQPWTQVHVQTWPHTNTHI